MELLDHKLKVAPTAALVLLHAQSLYESGASKAYLSQVDFGEAKLLSEQIEAVLRDFGTLVRYRKRFVRYLLNQYLSKEDPVQICILGSGLDPLSMYLLEHYNDSITRIFEIDNAHLSLKEQLYRRLLPDMRKLQFIQADITDTLHLPGRLRDAGYHPEATTIVLLEGLVYYITDEQFLNTMQFFRTQNKTNVAILDYILPDESVAESALPVYRTTRQLMEKVLEGALQLYSRQQMFAFIELLHGDVAGVDSMQDAEFKLNGRNQLYYQEGEGVIEMISFYI